ncbi:hypothetical protein SAMN04487819_11699 [Actinopolyspora alba]|uniref:Uncharacterized protein n=1 Tax=Actinopolyspora alba TaxID=673379 RepID=A0A1I2BH66_9ACTN|nr:hypothetical protein [Actinopolyspora alba]SFE55409.1 hypothetical protein SAMN04487819_11699 [Actinopolyspora alba]
MAETPRASDLRTYLDGFEERLATQLGQNVTELRASSPELLAPVDGLRAVLEVHRPHTAGLIRRCRHCGGQAWWPCPTVSAVMDAFGFGLPEPASSDVAAPSPTGPAAETPIDLDAARQRLSAQTIRIRLDDDAALAWRMGEIELAARATMDKLSRGELRGDPS